MWHDSTTSNLNENSRHNRNLLPAARDPSADGAKSDFYVSSCHHRARRYIVSGLFLPELACPQVCVQEESYIGHVLII